MQTHGKETLSSLSKVFLIVRAEASRRIVMLEALSNEGLATRETNGKNETLDHRITKMEYGVPTTRSQDTQRRTVGHFMGSHNPLRKVIISKMGK